MHPRTHTCTPLCTLCLSHKTPPPHIVTRAGVIGIRVLRGRSREKRLLHYYKSVNAAAPLLYNIVIIYRTALLIGRETRAYMR